MVAIVSLLMARLFVFFKAYCSVFYQQRIHSSLAAVGSHFTEKVDNDVMQKIDKNCCVVLILLNLSPVFDTVDHNILLQRQLYPFCFRGEYWTSF